MSTKLSPLASLIMAGAALSATVHAAETVLPTVDVNADAARSFTPSTSRVWGKTPTALKDIPQTVSVINSAVIESQAATTLTEALRNVPGITLGAGEGGAIGDNISLRGYSARTDIYLDGFRDRGQYVRDTFFLDSVEVVKGPSSLFFGRGSTGGIINQSSKEAQRESARSASLTVGSHDYYRMTADINQAIDERSAVRVALMAQDVSTNRDVANNKSWGIAPSYTWGFGEATRFTLSALVQQIRSIPDYGVPVLGNRPAPVDKNRFYGTTSDFADMDVAMLKARIEHTLSDTLTLRNQTLWSQGKTATRPSAFRIVNQAVPLDAMQVKLSPKDREIDDSSIYNTTDLLANFKTGSFGHAVVAGLEIGRDTSKSQWFSWSGTPLLSLMNPVYTGMPSSAVRSKDDDHAKTVADTTSVYLNDTIELNKFWKVTAGLRHDRFKTTADTITSKGTTTLSRTDNATSYRTGLVWQPDAQQSYYVSYGTSFNPSAEAVSLSSANASVDPEKSRSWELGSHLTLLDGNLDLNGALFRVEKNNARTTDPVTRQVTLDGNNHVQGIELSAVGRIGRDWKVIAAWTELRSRIDKTRDSGVSEGNELSNTPRRSASLWATWSPVAEWEIGTGANGVSRRFTSNANQVFAPGYVRWDAMVAWHQKRYDVQLNLKNLADTTNYESIAASDGGRFVPGVGRTAMLTLKVKL